MSSESPRPPRLARQLLQRTLPADVCEHVTGDLEEVYGKHCREFGERRARRWYWREAVSFSARFLRERLRGGAPDASTVQLPSSQALRAGPGGGGISWIDVKLGFRMLVKYPMLSLVGGLAITVAASIGVGASEFVRDMLVPKLPLEEADRIVHLTNAGAGARLHDFVAWKEQLQSVADLGASRTIEQGVVTSSGQTGSVSVAQISASAFDMTRVPPELGRYLSEADEQVAAPAVVVLGHESWQRLFGGDPSAIGQVVELSGSPTIFVGVMPEGYGFPVNQDAWVPLRFNRTDAIPGSGPPIRVFGRLAEGVSLEEARAEVTAVGQRTAAAFPETHGQLRAEINHYGAQLSGGQMALAFSGVRLFLSLLLLVACANVATLVFARTVTREAEIAVRMSMGATRRRIVLQLFTEALVLVSVGTLAALALTSWALGRIAALFVTVQQAELPFWWNDSLSLSTILYAGVLVLVGSLMIGVVPALKATAGQLKTKLGESSSGGSLRFGGIWTAVIVFQVALSVAMLPLAVDRGGLAFVDPRTRSTFPAHEYLTGQLGRDATIAPRNDAEREAFLEESRQLFEEVKLRAQADARVQSVAFASGLSGLNHVLAPVEFVGDGTSPPVSAWGVRTLLVDDAYLEMMGAKPVAGRALQPADFAVGSRSVVVNESFVEVILEGRNAVGGQLRFPERRGEASEVAVPAPGSSVDVVGVVKNPGIDEFGPGAHPVIYAPLTLAPVTPGALGLVGMPQAPAIQLFVHLKPGAEFPATGLYQMVSAVNPSLIVRQAGTAEDAWTPVHRGERLLGWIFMAVTGSVLMLAVFGIYALMSFTVSQRTREIAIRTAVGGTPTAIVASVLRRSFIQLALGALVGVVIASPVLRNSLEGGGRDALIVAGLLVGAGLASCVVPIRRALRIHPSHAMKTG